jgi:hypothetical protein
MEPVASNVFNRDARVMMQVRIAERERMRGGLGIALVIEIREERELFGV